MISIDYSIFSFNGVTLEWLILSLNKYKIRTKNNDIISVKISQTLRQKIRHKL
jgi:hypothetical protein